MNEHSLETLNSTACQRQFVRRPTTSRMSNVGVPQNWIPKRVNAVIRFSDPRQKEGSSEFRQKTHIQQFLDRVANEKWPEVNWIEIHGVSAYNAKKNNLSADQQLGLELARIRDGKGVGELFIWDDLDRFSRLPVDKSTNELLDLPRKGVFAYFCSLHLFLYPFTG